MAPALAGLLDLGLAQSGTDYQKIVLRREAFRGAVRLLFESVDLIAVPAQAFAAPTLAKMAALGEDASLIARIAALHLSVRHDRKPDHYASRRLRPERWSRSPFSLSAATSMKRRSSAPATRSSASPTGTRVIPRSDPEEPFAWQKIG